MEAAASYWPLYASLFFDMNMSRWVLISPPKIFWAESSDKAKIYIPPK
jgi:hypothetical protein